MMNLNSFKEKMKDGPIFGSFVTMGGPELAEFTALLGYDYILIDNEHGNFDNSTIGNMVRASQGVGVPAIVRIPPYSYENVPKMLDMGSNGVMVPLINTPEEGQVAANVSLYPPEGKRGVAFQTRAANYGLYPDKVEYLNKANLTRFLGLQIETLESIGNLDKLLEIEGVDVYFIGPGDLSTSMGYPVGHPEVKKIIGNTIKRINEKGKKAGIYVGTSEEAKQAIEWGAKFILTITTPHMVSGAKAFLAPFKEKVIK